MKKFRIIAAFVLVALASVGILAACVDDPTSEKINYGITPLLELTDFGTSEQFYAPQALSYNPENNTYNGINASAKAEALQKKIDEQKANFDKRFNQASGWEEVEQSTFEKIFAHATPSGILKSLADAAISVDHMNGLVDYMTGDGVKGFFGQYKHMQDCDEIMNENPESSTAYQDAYKDQQRLRRKMLQKLGEGGTGVEGIGLSGDEIGRIIIQLSTYAQTVVNDNMIPVYMNGANIEQYFKALESKGGLFDYDTLVFFKTNETLRGTVTGTKGASDAQLVRAYGFIYQYQVKANSETVLSQADFEEELKYRFKSSLTQDEAVEFARIKRLNYAKAYRYSANFYKEKFYPAVNVLERKQEEIEAVIYEINDGKKVDTVTVSGNGVTSEENIEIKLSTEISKGSSAALSSEMSLFGIRVGIESDLLAGDMEYYYNGVDNYRNAKSMAAAQANYEKSNKSSATSWAPARLQLQLENLRMTYFVLDQFISEGKKAGLSSSLVGQIYAVAADDIKTVNQLKKDLVLMVAQLEDIDQINDSEAYFNEAAKIGRKNAQLKSFVKAATEVVSNIDTRIRYANQGAQWENIRSEVNSAIEADYSKYKVTDKGTTPQLNYMQFLLVKQTFTENNKKIDYIKGVDGHEPQNPATTIDYDTEHGISQLYVNEKQVLYHTAGIIEVSFQKVGTVNTDTSGATTITYQTFVTREIQSGETLKTGDGWTSDKAQYPLPSGSVGDEVRGPLSADYKFQYWSLDQGGFYPIDYDEEIRYDETTYYAYFKIA